MDLPNTNTNIIPTQISNGNGTSNPASNSDPNRSTAHNLVPNPNPFSDPTLQQPHTDVITVSRSGTTLVTNITKYLSTLPHPIEIVEELVAVCAVTASLLLSLNSAILRFPHLNLSPTNSFIAPLCHDILFAYKLLGERVQEAKRMRVFEPNDVGLVRLPRSAWTLVLGTEAKVAALRSRLYVEKYRVRVLIDAVTWEGLRGLGAQGRSKREEDELRSLRRMVPLVAERLVGVQRDYKPRLMRLAGLVVDANLVLPEAVGRGVSMKTVVVPTLAGPAPAQAPGPVSVPAPTPAPVVQEKTKVEMTQEPCSEKKALHSSHSSQSLAPTSSSITTKSDNIHETWVLHYNRPKKALKSRTSIFGMPLVSTHTYSSPTYYVKPILSSPDETASLLKSCYQATSTHSDSPAETQPIASLRRALVNMPEDAKSEIQRLVEARERDCSSEKVRRSWELVGLMERCRRELVVGCEEDKKGLSLRGLKSKFKREKKVVEWVLVLRGQTEDWKERVLPGKHENAWKDVDEAKGKATPAATMNAQVQAQRQVPVQQQGTVLRHVENRRILSPEEAEVKMREIISDLFIQNEDEETDSEDEEGDEESDEEDESEIEDGSEIETADESQQNGQGRD
ncbi:hypothetical protein BKA61DRAFT_677918 [Leptodontidium sp. MPI-SDFR-AT-0119]|nr:hypothetical protein BKA61DRAFT_677918 [Leptodontidium sp. MPI-SDFR-AT-0119]